MAIKRDDLLHYLWCNDAQFFKNCSSLSGKIISIEMFGEESEVASVGYHYSGVGYLCNGVRIEGNMRIAPSLSAWQRFVNRDSTLAQDVDIVLVGEVDGAVECDDYNTTIIHVPIADSLYQRYIELSLSNGVECCDYITSLNSFSFVSLFDNLIVDRIDYKLAWVEGHFNRAEGDYGATLVSILFDSFMIATPNRTVMNELCKSIKVNAILNDIDSLEMVEALLLGCAGFLSHNTATSDHLFGLYKRFEQLKKSYKLLPLSSRSWRGGDYIASKTKWVQIAQLAALLFRPLNLMTKVSNAKTVEELDALLQVEPSQYWKESSMPSKEREQGGVATISEQTRTKILINGIIPFYGFYKINYLQEDYIDVRSTMAQMLTELKPERNKIVQHFTSRDVVLSSAADTQAVIHLYKFFCSAKQCYKCKVGRRLLKGIK